MSLYSKWAQREHPLGRRIAALLPAGILFAFLLPLVVVRSGPRLDRLLGLPSFHIGAANYVVGGVLVIAGLFFAQWSIYAQLTKGRGTPLPMLATQELLTRGPFRYCRNPMTFGTILAYLGLAIAVGTIAGVGMVLLFAALLVVYLKRLEEGELAERFGDAYLAYKREVPFIIPRRPKRE
jgi:protein-S-isoprenylcysteine O-methyltransferase Ste14